MDLLYYLVLFINVLEVKFVLTRKSRLSSNVFYCPQRSGYFADPSNCTKFYQCDHNVPHSVNCPPGTVFNDAIYVCDYLRNVPRCQEPIPKTFICPKSQGLFRNPDNCTTYYNCGDSRATLSHCQQGLYFNQERLYCDWPINVPECNQVQEPLPEEHFSCPHQQGKFRHPVNCATFYICEDYRATLAECPSGLYFDQWNYQCNLPEYVSDCKNTQGTTNFVQVSSPAVLPYKDALLTSTAVPIHQEESKDVVIVKGLTWLSQQRENDYGWKSETPYALQIYQFNNPKWFNDKNLESQIIVRQCHIQLLAELVRDPTLVNMPIKELAMEISALIGICRNPYNFHGVDLVSLLKHKMDVIISSRNSLEDLLSYPLAVIALCQFNITVEDTYLQHLNQISKKVYDYNIESRSLVIIALSCIKKQFPTSFNYNTEIELYFKYIFKHQHEDGSFPGMSHNPLNHIRSTALAAQVLMLNKRDTNQALQKANNYLRLNQKEDGSYEGGIESLHNVIAVLKGLTILNINSSHCYETVKTPAITDEVPESDRTTAEALSSQIKIKYTIIDTVHKRFNISKYFTVPPQIDFYTIFQMIAMKDNRFRFVSEETDLGHLIKSVNNLEEDKTNSNYWFIYRTKPGGKMKLDDSDGLEKIFPVNNEEIFLIYEHFVFDV